MLLSKIQYISDQRITSKMLTCCFLNMDNNCLRVPKAETVLHVVKKAEIVETSCLIEEKVKCFTYKNSYMARGKRNL